MWLCFVCTFWFKSSSPDKHNHLFLACLKLTHNPQELSTVSTRSCVLRGFQLSYRIFRNFTSVPRRTTPQFINHDVKFINPLMFVTGWHPDRIVFCEMHTVHLGICQWMNGCTIHVLAKYKYFGDVKLPEALEVLTRRFNSWCKLTSIRHYQPFIPVSVLVVKDGEYPELRLKAYTSRVLTTFLALCLRDLCTSNDVEDKELMMATVSMTKLSDWMLQLERTPRYMTRAHANQLEALSWEFPSWSLVMSS